jgi:hypothetical protein
MSAEYPGLLHCYRCGAHYRAGNWMTARFEGTAPPIPVARLDDNNCPICRRPPDLEKPKPIPLRVM